MATITAHTTRADGTRLTDTIYNSDHVNHVTNATALNTAKLERDGSVAATANQPMGGFLHTGAGAGSATGHYARWDEFIRGKFAKGADIVSAAALAPGTDGNYFDVTGVVTITSINTVAVGAVLRLHFDGILTLTHHATDLILPGGADILTAAGDEATFVEYATGDWRCIGYVGGSKAHNADGTHRNRDSRINGLTLSNNGVDATNDIDIAAGSCIDLTASAHEVLVLASSLTKRLDAAWAVGTGNGGLDTGAIANTTYHIWLIKRPDTGVVDALFSASASAPSMPTNYTIKRRIGSLIRVAAALQLFVQVGDRFMLKSSVQDVNTANPGTAAVTATLASIPTGVVVLAKFAFLYFDTTPAASQMVSFVASDLTQTDVAASSTNFTSANQIITGTGQQGWGEMQEAMTNTSSQIRYRISNSDADVTIYLVTSGWNDRRGQD